MESILEGVLDAHGATGWSFLLSMRWDSPAPVAIPVRLVGRCNGDKVIQRQLFRESTFELVPYVPIQKLLQRILTTSKSIQYEDPSSS
jgi:hypothetical protein